MGTVQVSIFLLLANFRPLLCCYGFHGLKQCFIINKDRTFIKEVNFVALQFLVLSKICVFFINFALELVLCFWQMTNFTI